MPVEIDRERTEALAAQLLAAVRPVLQQSPYGPHNIYVALNALAFALCQVLAGTGFNPAALTLFRRALAEIAVEIGAERGMPCELPAWLAEGLNDVAKHAEEGPDG
jgi:hypothetical protein